MVLTWLRRRDRGLIALRRAGRTAIVMPAMFAVGDLVIGNTTTAAFAAFGSFASLLLFDPPGPMRARLRAQLALAVAGAVLVCLGTVAEQSAPTAAVATAIVTFGIIFSGVVSSLLAGATTSLLLAFILAVCLPGPVSSIPDRLVGWGLASAGALLAVALLWPAPARDPVRSAAIAACRALGARLRTEVAHRLGEADRPTDADYAAAVAEADARVAALHDVFYATPYRPTGLSTAARTVVRLVDELQWMNGVLVHAASPAGVRVDRSVCDVKLAAAAVLERGAELLDAPQGSPAELGAALDELQARVAELERDARRRLVLSSIDPSFRAQELSFVVAAVGRNIDLAAAAERRSWLAQLMGREPTDVRGTLASAQERAGAHVERHSLWLQNSVRGAVGLGIAVLIADLSDVSHGFWVVLGTLSVLRSNALSTGQDVLRALLGTAVGFVIGAGIVVAVGTDTTLLWVLLPFAILLAGLAPATASFAAGQAAFTLTVLIVFNILAPEGWRIGLVRIEDVALGCAVSVVVGLLFWPRGAAAALSIALANAYRDSARYLAAARPLRARPLRRGDRPGAGAGRARGARRRGLAAPRRRVPHLPGRARRQAGAARRGDVAARGRDRPAAGRRRRARRLDRRRHRRRRSRRRPPRAARHHRRGERLVRGLRRRPDRPRHAAGAAARRRDGVGPARRRRGGGPERGRRRDRRDRRARALDRRPPRRRATAAGDGRGPGP